jgi:hypothetical protein
MVSATYPRCHAGRGGAGPKYYKRFRGTDDYLRRFVFAKVGQVETYKDNKEKLQEITSGN